LSGFFFFVSFGVIFGKLEANQSGKPLNRRVPDRCGPVWPHPLPARIHSRRRGQYALRASLYRSARCLSIMDVSVCDARVGCMPKPAWSAVGGAEEVENHERLRHTPRSLGIKSTLVIGPCAWPRCELNDGAGLGATIWWQRRRCYAAYWTYSGLSTHQAMS